jgi:hypothetical protein
MCGRIAVAAIGDSGWRRSIFRRGRHGGGLRRLKDDGQACCLSAWRAVLEIPGKFPSVEVVQSRDVEVQCASEKGAVFGLSCGRTMSFQSIQVLRSFLATSLGLFRQIQLLESDDRGLCLTVDKLSCKEQQG